MDFPRWRQARAGAERFNMSEKIILLAEDDLNDAQQAREALAAAGIKNRVIRVMDGREAIDYLKGDGEFGDRQKFPFPSVLMVDVKMPRVDGFQVLDWVKQNIERWKLLVIALSGFGELQNVKKAYALGANSFSTKPCQVEDIRNLIRVHKRFLEDVPPSSAKAA